MKWSGKWLPSEIFWNCSRYYIWTYVRVEHKHRTFKSFYTILPGHCQFHIWHGQKTIMNLNDKNYSNISNYCPKYCIHLLKWVNSLCFSEITSASFEPGGDRCKLKDTLLCAITNSHGSFWLAQVLHPCLSYSMPTATTTDLHSIIHLYTPQIYAGHILNNKLTFSRSLLFPDIALLLFVPSK